ncbi:four helix bundle protein [bacterium]|nr:four helix bundle protein [bacterium]
MKRREERRGKVNENEIQCRSYEFAIRVIKLVSGLPQTQISKVLGGQILRSGTSVGANVEEAIGAYSKNDFTNKMNIAQKEARESNYWLRLIRDSGFLNKERMEPIIQESEEIIKILTSIVKTSKQ